MPLDILLCAVRVTASRPGGSFPQWEFHYITRHEINSGLLAISREPAAMATRAGAGALACTLLGRFAKAVNTLAEAKMHS